MNVRQQYGSAAANDGMFSGGLSRRMTIATEHRGSQLPGPVATATAKHEHVARCPCGRSVPHSVTGTVRPVCRGPRS